MPVGVDTTDAILEEDKISVVKNSNDSVGSIPYASRYL